MEDQDMTMNSPGRDDPASRGTADTAPSMIVGIGASAGGLEALESFFVHTPPDSGLAYVVIQHLSPDYKSLMVELLSKKTTMPVQRAENGMQVLANQVYLIPPKHNLTIFHGKLILTSQTPDRVVNLPIDVFLRSLAEDQESKAVAIILSGTGSDGTRGVRAIKEHNGLVLVQSEESAKFDGMPRAAASTGLVDAILSPDEMPAKLLAVAQHPSHLQPSGERVLHDEDGLNRIFLLLRERTKVDFTHYKQSTIGRRIERRMLVCQAGSLAEYVRHIQSYPGEVLALYRELLIGVTRFFRDEEAFGYFSSDVLPDLLRRRAGQELRVWIVGCSSGEEAYTHAILLRECMEVHGLANDVKIFATDIDQNAIETASRGMYPESITADLSPQLLGKYFYRKQDVFQIARHLREMVVFARHNVLRDPPFTNIDLVSCRNLLIYLQPVLQERVMDMFRFALRNDGVLMLGTSETLGNREDRFEVLHSKHKIYRLRPGPGVMHSPATLQGRAEDLRRAIRPEARKGHSVPRQDEWLYSRLLDTVADRYVPRGVVVNQDLEIVHTLGDTSEFFKIPSGRVVLNVAKMVAKDLAIPLSTGVQKAFRSQQEVVYTNLPLDPIEEGRRIRMRVVPLPDRKGQEPLVGVFLEDMTVAAHGEETHPEGVTLDLQVETREHMEDLENELQFVRENLQATIEELETSNEELQATNEELLASNEELQSTNEELQSTNEELHTVNSEYQNKILELTELTNDIDNLLTSSRIGQVLLDENLEIRRFSPRAAEVFQLSNGDIGRPLAHINHTLLDFDPMEAIRSVVDQNEVIEQEVVTREGRWFLLRILPYLIAPNTSSGLVISLVDISERIEIHRALKQSRTVNEAMIQYTPAGVFIYRLGEDGILRLTEGNEEAMRLTGVDPEVWKGRGFDEIWPQAHADGITDSFLEVVRSGKPYTIENLPYSDENTSGSYRIRAFRLPENHLAVSFEDVGPLHHVEAELEASEHRYHTLFNTMPQGVVYQDREGRIVRANPAAERILGLTVDQLRGRTSMDPRWKATDARGHDLAGERHPVMIALRTGKPVHGFIMTVFNPKLEAQRTILVNAIPLFREGAEEPYQAYATFEDTTDWLTMTESGKSVGDVKEEGSHES